MNIRKISSIFLFTTMIFTFINCGNSDNAAVNGTKETVANSNAQVVSNPTSEVIPKPVSPNGASDINITGSVIKGNLANSANLRIFLDKSSLSNSNQVIAQGPIDGSGNFNLGVPEGFETGIYRIRIGAQKNHLILSGEETNIEVSGDLTNLKSFGINVKGSEATSEYYELMKGLMAAKVTPELAKRKLTAVKNPLVGIWAAHLVFPAGQSVENTQAKLEIQKSALAKLQSKIKTKPLFAEINTAIRNDEAQIEAQKAREAAELARQKVKVGEMAPNITLKSPDGKSYSLSDLKGKVVLLDFWASWCGPCRKENPHVVETYKKYNKKGFEVFSVSLDGIHPKVRPRLKTQEQIDQQMTSAKTKWEQAIAKDNLMWKYHVSDLQHWGSPVAKSYGVSSIPKTFLIDKNGRIAAINPRGPKLEPALLEVL